MFDNLLGRFVLVRTDDHAVYMGILADVVGPSVRLELARGLAQDWAHNEITMQGLATEGLKSVGTAIVKTSEPMPEIVLRRWKAIFPMSDEAAETFVDLDTQRIEGEQK